MSGSSVARPEACAWQSAHVYYYDEQKDALLLDCIQPLFAQARPITPRLFFVRHWLRGPHLRLRFYCSSMQFAATLKPLIESTVGGYLRQHPSTTRLDEEQLKPLYATLARQEQETGPLFPLYPDNSIQYLPYDRRLQVLGSEALASLLEDFYVDTNDLAFAMLAYLRQGHSLLTLCFDLMITVAIGKASIWRAAFSPIALMPRASSLPAPTLLGHAPFLRAAISSRPGRWSPDYGSYWPPWIGRRIPFLSLWPGRS